MIDFDSTYPEGDFPLPSKRGTPFFSNWSDVCEKKNDYFSLDLVEKFLQAAVQNVQEKSLENDEDEGNLSKRCDFSDERGVNQRGMRPDP